MWVAVGSPNCDYCATNRKNFGDLHKFVNRRKRRKRRACAAIFFVAFVSSCSIKLVAADCAFRDKKNDLSFELLIL